MIVILSRLAALLVAATPFCATAATDIDSSVAKRLAGNRVAILSSSFPADAATFTFVWPREGLVPWVWTQSGATGGGTVTATLVTTP